MKPKIGSRCVFEAGWEETGGVTDWKADDAVGGGTVAVMAAVDTVDDDNKVAGFGKQDEVAVAAVADDNGLGASIDLGNWNLVVSAKVAVEVDFVDLCSNF